MQPIWHPLCIDKRHKRCKYARRIGIPPPAGGDGIARRRRAVVRRAVDALRAREVDRLQERVPEPTADHRLSRLVYQHRRPGLQDRPERDRAAVHEGVIRDTGVARQCHRPQLADYLATTFAVGLTPATRAHSRNLGDVRLEDRDLGLPPVRHAAGQASYITAANYFPRK